MIYCLQPGLHGEEFEGAELYWCRLREEQKRVVWSIRHGHGVAREGGELSEQGLEAVDRQTVSRALGSGLATRSRGTLRGCDDGGSRGGSLGALMIVNRMGASAWRMCHSR